MSRTCSALWKRMLAMQPAQLASCLTSAPDGCGLRMTTPMPTRGSDGKLLSCPVCMLQCLAGSLSLLAMPGAMQAL